KLNIGYFSSKTKCVGLRFSPKSSKILTAHPFLHKHITLISTPVFFQGITFDSISLNILHSSLLVHYFVHAFSTFLITELLLKNGVATLEIQEVMLSDSGNYTCEVLNESGCESCSTKVTPLSIEAVRGSVAVLACELSGSSPFEVSWKKNKKRLNTDKKYRIMSQGAVTSLEIHSFESADTGEYECVVSNEVGSVTSKSGTLKGSAPITVKWMKDSELLRDDDPNVKMKYENNITSISFSSVEIKHSGKYTCVAENEAGQQNGPLHTVGTKPSPQCSLTCLLLPTLIRECERLDSCLSPQRPGVILRRETI
uniref:Ig-like domain-containing protein n=1 Tax=Seriola lalandi dorsalis TaxID=1841481 RepID=A0A3B4WPY0_SERLL